MRALVGDQRWRQHAIETSIPRVVHSNQQQQPLQITAPTAETPARRLDFDSDNESIGSSSPDVVVGLTIEAVNGGTITPAEANHNNNPPDNSNNIDDDERRRRHERQLDEEGDVVLSALFTGAWSYVSWLAGLGGEAAYDLVVEPASSMVSVAGIGASVLSLGVGFWGVSTGFYNRPGHSSPTSTFSASSMLPPSRVLVSTAILGGVSAGVMLYARSSMHDAVKSPKKPPPPKKNPGDGSEDQN